jgi:hypothetical protein
MKTDKRLERLEQIQQSKNWSGRIVAIREGDGFNITETDSNGKRSEYDSNELPNHENRLTIL